MATPGQRLTIIDSPPARESGELAEGVREGLTARPKTLPCRFFYDRRGSELFERICELPEYYVTRVEREILEDNAAEIAGLFPRGTSMVELGSGSSTKTRVLIEAFLAAHGRLRYLPMDISRTILVESSEALIQAYDGLEIIAIAAEYNRGLRELSSRARAGKLILWLGSTLGNFERRDASHFLSKISRTMTAADGLLVGVDLRKSREVLEAAYDDASRVTARFNLNLLSRINRELGGSFNLRRFRHLARYDELVGRVEMHLVSTAEQTVRIEDLDLNVPFGRGETIHTESSYKYSVEEIAELAETAGLEIARQWFDAQRRFCVCLFRRCAD